MNHYSISSNQNIYYCTALGQAINVATSLVKFPQECMLIDRNSTYNAAFNSAYLDLLKYEQSHGFNVIMNESVSGAKRFVEGVGRHGKCTNLKEKEAQEWEKEFEAKSKL